MQSYKSDRCINPHKIECHKGKDLRPISDNLKRKFPYLPERARICCKCRKKCADSDLNNTTPSSDDDEAPENHFPEAEQSIEETRSSPTLVQDSRTAREIELEEMFSELKEKFANLSVNDPLKVTILTIAPSNWSINKIAAEFGASKRLARKAKQLKAQKGVLATTVAKAGKSLPDSIKNAVNDFYNNDLYTRMTPGRKSKVFVQIDGERVEMQKRLILFDLSELYDLFKIANPKIEIGFSTFAKLRPKNCILAGAKGTHSVCVCTIHQNAKMMLDAIDVKELTAKSEIPLTNYRDCLDQTMCRYPTPKCHLNECSSCPGNEKISSLILTLFKKSNISHVEYSAWTATDRSTLQNLTSSVDEYIDELKDQLDKLRPHSFIAKEQTNFINEKKDKLNDDEVLVMFDFSENYAYAVQDASQAFHFNNDQCTVFPAIYYYKQNSEIKHESCIFLSESLKHDTVAVYTVQTKLVAEIKKKVKKVKKIIYSTDGAKQHFKNRFQIANLIEHEEDFGIKAEWHYSATAHGKSSYDGLGAIFKREAYRASLIAKPKDAILNSDTLFQWAQKHFKNINIFKFSKVEHERNRRKLNKRFANAKAVPNILKSHSFQITSSKKVSIKRYSASSDNVTVTL